MHVFVHTHTHTCTHTHTHTHPLVPLKKNRNSSASFAPSSQSQPTVYFLWPGPLAWLPTSHTVLGCCPCLPKTAAQKSPSSAPPCCSTTLSDPSSLSSSGLILSPWTSVSFPASCAPPTWHYRLLMPRTDSAPSCSQPSGDSPVPWWKTPNMQDCQSLWLCLTSLSDFMLWPHQAPSGPLTRSSITHVSRPWQYCSLCPGQSSPISASSRWLLSLLHTAQGLVSCKPPPTPPDRECRSFPNAWALWA